MSAKYQSIFFGLILLLCATFVHSQNIRAELGGPVSAGIATVGGAGVGGLSPLFALPGVTLAWCNHPANAVPCTNYANTYPSMSSTSPCSTSPTPTQVVLQGSTSCQATDDNFGNMGVWTLPNTVCGGITCYDYTLTVNGVSSGPYVWTTGTSLGNVGGNPTLDNCTPDETGNSFYSVTSLTNYFLAAWQFVFNTTTYINCTIYVPTAQSGATVVVDCWSPDSTAGHTASITYADGVINAGTMNIGSLTAASPQTFTTTSTANSRQTLTFNVQSTLANGSILIVKLGTAPTGTAPTANIQCYPHFVL